MEGETMRLQLKEIIAAYQALVRIGNMPLHPRTSYWMSRNWQQLRPVAERIERDRTAIIIKHGTLDAATNQVTVQPAIEVDGEQKPNPAVDACTADLEALVSEEVEVTIHKLPLSGFMGTISMADINALNFMIEEEAESNLISLPRPTLIK